MCCCVHSFNQVCLWCSQPGRGFGFVEFESEEGAQAATALSGATVTLQPERPDLLRRITVVRRACSCCRSLWREFAVLGFRRTEPSFHRGTELLIVLRLRV